jgi:hypothetical protein
MNASKGKAAMPCTSVEHGELCGIAQIPGGAEFDPERPRESVEEMVEGAAVWFEEWVLRGRIALEEVEADWTDGLKAFGRAIGKGEEGETELKTWELDVANWLMGWDGRRQGFEQCS